MSDRAPQFRRYASAALMWAVTLACPVLGAEPATQVATDFDRSSADVSVRIRQQLVDMGDAGDLLKTLRGNTDQNAASLEFLARVAEESGDLAQARKAWQALAQIRTQDSSVFVRLASVCEMLADDSAAIQALEHAIELAPQNADAARLRLAAIYYDQANPGAAAKVIRARVAQNSSRQILNSSGIVAASYGDFSFAAELLTMPSPEPADLYTHLLAGTMLLSADQPKKAESEFSQALDLATTLRDRRFIRERMIACARQYKGLSALADNWIKSDKTAPEDLFSLLTVLREVGRGQDALELLDHKSNLVSEAKSADANTVLLEAIAIAVESSRIDDAAAIYRKMIEKDPANIQWTFALASLELSRDNTSAADTYLNDALKRAKNAGAIMAVAESSQKLGRWQIAAQSVEALKTLPDQMVPALLLEARIARDRGDSERFSELLTQASTAAKNVTERLAITDALEQAGNRKLAIEQLLQLSRETKNDAVSEHLAWLLEQENQLPRAYEIWSEVWRTASNPARKQQAKRRMLDLAARIGSIADLAISLEDNLARGKAGPDDLGLLIDIYTEAKDPASAAEIMQTFRAQAGGEIAMLWRLSELYLQCDRFGQAHKILKQLVEKDPDHAIDALRQIAVLAVERKNVADALDALDEIHRRTQGAENLATLRGGILDHLGQYADAAREFRRGIAVQPEQTEEWILWASAMARSGKKDAAIARLLVLMDQTDNDELLLIAADGLMNLESPRDTLRFARRRSVLKIAQVPSKVFLYTLAVDLCQAIADDKASLRVRALSIPVAGEQRAAILREMMNHARTLRDSDTAIACGNTLLALDDQMPPQVFLEHGQLLLTRRRVVEADRAFSRALTLSGNDDSITRQIADVYQNAGYSEAAVRLLRGLARLNETDLQLQIRTAGVLEQIGDFAPASRHYSTALSLIMRRMPARRESDTIAPSGASSKDRQSRGNATSLNEFQDLYDVALEGWLASARTPELRQEMLSTISAWVNHELAQTSVAGKLSDYLRLERYTLMLRRVAFAFHQPELADQLDRRLLAAFPADTALASQLVQERLVWGLLPQAQEFARNANVPDVTLQSSSILRLDAAEFEKRIPTIPPALAATILPQLIMRNRNQHAALLLNSALDADGKNDSANFPIFAVAAYALRDDALLEKTLNTWIAQVGVAYARRSSRESVLPFIATLWPQLSDSARNRIAEKLVNAIRDNNSVDQSSIAISALRVLHSGGKAPAIADTLIPLAMQKTPATADLLSDLLLAIPPAQQTEILGRYFENKPKNTLRQTILSLIATLDHPLDSAVEDELCKLLQDAPAPRTTSDRSSIFPNDWCRNTTQKRLLPKLARILTADKNAEPYTLTCAALALQTAGLQKDSEALARRTISVIGSTAKGAALLPELFSIFSSSAQEQLLAELDSAKDAASSTIGKQLVRAALLTQLQRYSESVDAYKSVLSAEPRHNDARKMLLDLLEQQLRFADILSIWSALPKDADASRTAERGRVFRAAMQLQRFADSELYSSAAGPMEAIQKLQIAEARGDLPQILRQIRSVLISNRREHRAYTPLIPSTQSLGGLTDFLAPAVKPRRAAWELLAADPTAFDELLGLLDSMPPGGREVSGAHDGLIAAASAHGKIDSLLVQLGQWANTHALTMNDRALMMRAFREGATTIPAQLAADFDNTLLLTPATETASLGALARAYDLHADSSHALALLRWSVAADSLGVGSVGEPAGMRQRQENFAKMLAGDKPSAELDKLLIPDSPWSSTESSGRWRKLELLLSARAFSQAAALLADLTPANAEDSDWRHNLLSASVHIASGNEKQFQKYLLVAIRNFKSSRGASVFDIRPALISGVLTPGHVQIILDSLQQSYSDGSISGNDVVRTACILGDWCARQKMSDHATRAFNLALTASKIPGEQDLWIIDLASRIGQQDAALQRQQKLLQLQLLPLPRVLKLIDSVEKSTGQAPADRLATQAATYTDAPVILQRALRDAQSRGADAEVSAIRTRLEQMP